MLSNNNIKEIILEREDEKKFSKIHNKNPIFH
jgi:hypothetical protein